MEIRVRGRGVVSLEELEARLSAHMNAGAPEPVLEGSPEEKKAIFEEVARRGDSQMQSLMHHYLAKEESAQA
jgi:hypothetical protein